MATMISSFSAQNISTLFWFDGDEAVAAAAFGDVGEDGATIGDAGGDAGGDTNPFVPFAVVPVPVPVVPGEDRFRTARLPRGFQVDCKP